jgi:hypothetical protein
MTRVAFLAALAGLLGLTGCGPTVFEQQAQQCWSQYLGNAELRELCLMRAQMAELADQERRARISAAMLAMSQGLQNQQAATSATLSSTPSPFHSYVINGRTLNCSTIGTRTTCH